MLYQEFNELGIPVFGLHGITHDNHCECLNPQCQALFKHPKNSSWQHTPIWDDEQMEVLELTDAFATGYGVLCKGILVIDVDARNGGVESYTKLVEDYPEILECGFIVETGSGGGSKHLYFKLPNPSPKLQSHLNAYKGIDFKSSGFVVGAGSMHKSGNKYRTVVGTPSDIEVAPKSILKLLEAKETVKHTSTYENQSLELTDDQLSEIINTIPNDGLEYDDWIMIGMAIHETTNGTGYDLWHSWSARSNKHDDRQMDIKWNSFGKNPSRYTVGTLIHLAKQNGYKFTHDIDVQEIETNINWNEKPKSKKYEFDLLNPPFLVGKIAKWISSRSLYPREQLSVATALMAVSSASGLRLRGVNNITGNLFIFCVAGSGTGKESIMQSYTALMKEAGIIQAVHGGIISEQEICRNVVDHQASFYTIDEFGETLNKIQNARKKGSGSSHLEGVIGALMSVYSKSNGIFLVPQTHKKRFKEELQKEISIIENRLKNNESFAEDEANLLSLKKRHKELDVGITNPYVNILGFTAPTKFNGLLDEDLADSGFFARALIVREFDDNPREKEDFVSVPFSEDKEMELLGKVLFNLYHSGHSSTSRVELLGETITLPYNSKVKGILKEISEYFWNMGEEQKENQGFVAYTRRGAEMVNKLALVLSAGESEIKEEAVLWAFEFIKKDMQDKILLTNANTREKTADGLVSRILSLLDATVGMSISQLKNKIRNYKPEDIESVIVILINKNKIVEKEIQPLRGKITKKYYRCDNN